MRPTREAGEEEAKGREILTEVEGDTRMIFESWKSFTSSFIKGVDSRMSSWLPSLVVVLTKIERFSLTREVQRLPKISTIPETMSGKIDTDDPESFPRESMKGA